MTLFQSAVGSHTSNPIFESPVDVATPFTLQNAGIPAAAGDTSADTTAALANFKFVSAPQSVCALATIGAASITTPHSRIIPSNLQAIRVLFPSSKAI
jgi:hypothetical protein